jgi:hypothetical protein
LEEGVFTKRSPRAIALSLKRSAERSRRRKSSPFRSAMSMLVFYQNRAGRGLTATQEQRLEKAKDELRAAFGKAPGRRKARPRKARRAGSGGKAQRPARRKKR